MKHDAPNLSGVNICHYIEDTQWRAIDAIDFFESVDRKASVKS
ncbi:hypothetical protein [Microcoleus sp. CAWBG58]|nr:hypothetical protein [Microcoleus sp. CAWBG58]